MMACQICKNENRIVNECGCDKNNMPTVPRLTAFRMFLMLLDGCKPNEWLHPKWIDTTIWTDLDEAVKRGELETKTVHHQHPYGGIAFYRKAIN